ncbi:isocitrate/isopropylmalate dehydrogenase family protein [Bacillus daqingensis]|uniref:Isocitrate/isopropylmalate dehydrogenase family protein n=1 Tax=Bacillus daqingensis TaxID=872396 RepID=A0ABV9NUC3_9BACI
MYRIGLLYGDDIGMEIMPHVDEMLQQLLSKQIATVEQLPIGMEAYNKFGTTFPENTLERLKEMHGWVLGPIGHSGYPQVPEAVNPHPIIRKHFDLHSNIRPSKSRLGTKPLHDKVDLLIVRENNEGFQPDRNAYIGPSEFMPSKDMSISMRIISRENCEKVARDAFEHALQRNQKVTAVHKKSVFKHGCGLFTEVCSETAKEYPTVTYEEINVDACAAALAQNPQQFDVIVTTNLFGDILSDLAAGVTGGLGLASGISAGSEYCMAQAVHGSAPDIAGKGLANPFALVDSAAMLLLWLGEKYHDQSILRAGETLREALIQAVSSGRATPDLNGTLTTSQMCSIIKENVSLQLTGEEHRNE